MSSYRAALGLFAYLAEELNDTIHVSLDPVEVSSALNQGRYGRLINPPRTTHVNANNDEHEWEIFVISPTRDAVEAWPALDDVADIIAELVDATETELSRYQPPHGDTPYPCAVLSCTTTTP